MPNKNELHFYIRQKREFIKSHYLYTVQEVKKYGKLWEINGETNEILMTADNLLHWRLDMYKLDYKFDSKLEAYEGPFDPKYQNFLKLTHQKQITILIKD